MARWVEVRVHSDDSSRTMEAILNAFAPVDVQLDLDPPRAHTETGEPAPEIAVRIESDTITEEQLLGVLHASLIQTYASRVTIGPKIEDALRHMRGPLDLDDAT